MTRHKVATREEWQAARNQLLAREKELTRRGDQLAAARRARGRATKATRSQDETHADPAGNAPCLARDQRPAPMHMPGARMISLNCPGAKLRNWISPARGCRTTTSTLATLR